MEESQASVMGKILQELSLPTFTQLMQGNNQGSGYSPVLLLIIALVVLEIAIILLYKVLKRAFPPPASAHSRPDAPAQSEAAPELTTAPPEVAPEDFLIEETLSGSTSSEDESTFYTELYEQERWAMPGFLSLAPSSYRPTLPALMGDLSGKKEENNEESADRFNFRSYMFFQTDTHGKLNTDTESFCKNLLESCGQLFDTVNRITLFLADRTGKVLPALEKQGRVFLSGDGIQKKLSSATMASLECSRIVMDDEGRTISVPLMSGGEFAGAVVFQSIEPLYKKEKIQKAQEMVSKYGEFLYQIKLVEKISTDPQTTLLNGYQFQADLVETFHKKELFRFQPLLLLIRFPASFATSGIAGAGLSLRTVFSNHFSFYRIATDVIALIGPSLDPEELKMEMIRYRKMLNPQKSPVLFTGGAVLHRDILNVDEWFARAGTALEQSADCRGTLILHNERGNSAHSFKNLTSASRN